jgi:3-oxoacyl-[acyl-carrier protein] reductase
MRLNGRVALVTGSSRGIGAAIARRLAADGAKIILHASASRERAEQVAEAIRADGGTADIVIGELETREAPARVVGEAFDVHGALDILVNNAAVMLPSPVSDPNVETIDRELAVNVRAVILAVAEFARLTQSPHGRVINLSSVSASHASYGRSVYSATKGAIEAYTRSVAHELGERGITVNAVAPGVTMTDVLQRTESEEGRSWSAIVSRWTALRRLGTPDDIADIVAFLASDEARWLTGTTLVANGGAVASGGTIAAYVQ